MAEWFKALDSKSRDGDEPSVGSNPTLPAIQRMRYKRGGKVLDFLPFPRFSAPEGVEGKLISADFMPV